MSRARNVLLALATAVAACAVSAGASAGTLTVAPLTLFPGVFRRPLVLLPQHDVEPQAPTGLAFAVDGQVVTLRWQPTMGATDYVVQAGTAAGRSDVFNASIGPLALISGVVPRGRYYVRVLARNGLGTSQPSAYSSRGSQIVTW